MILTFIVLINALLNKGFKYFNLTEDRENKHKQIN